MLWQHQEASVTDRGHVALRPVQIRPRYAQERPVKAENDRQHPCRRREPGCAPAPSPSVRRGRAPPGDTRHQLPVTDIKALCGPCLPKTPGACRWQAAAGSEGLIRVFFGGGTQKQKRRGHMTKTAWQKMLQLPEERGAQERLSCEENWLYQSWCDFSSCPGAAWLVAAGRAVPPRQRGTRRFSLQRDRCACGALDTGVNWALPVIFPFPELLQSQGDELASGKSWLVVRFLTL